MCLHTCIHHSLSLSLSRSHRHSRYSCTTWISLIRKLILKRTSHIFHHIFSYNNCITHWSRKQPFSYRTKHSTYPWYGRYLFYLLARVQSSRFIWLVLDCRFTVSFCRSPDKRSSGGWGKVSRQKKTTIARDQFVWWAIREYDHILGLFVVPLCFKWAVNVYKLYVLQVDLIAFYAFHFVHGSDRFLCELVESLAK